jgi:hypothetical protein
VNAAFDPTGGFLLFGNRDGTVYVCNLEQVRKRLDEVGMGWAAPP